MKILSRTKLAVAMLLAMFLTLGVAGEDDPMEGLADGNRIDGGSGSADGKSVTGDCSDGEPGGG